MADGVVLPTVIYLIESWEAEAGRPSMQTQELGAPSSVGADVGGTLRHETFGEGQVLKSATTRHGTVVTVDFGPRIGDGASCCADEKALNLLDDVYAERLQDSAAAVSGGHA